MDYSKYLQEIEQVSTGSAILTLRGKHLCHKGDWKANQREEINYSNIFSKPNSHTGQRIKYNGKDFIINRADDDMIFAQSEKEGIVFQKTDSLIFCAYYVEGQVANNVSAKIYFAIRELYEDQEKAEAERRYLEEQIFKKEGQLLEAQRIKMESKPRPIPECICATCKNEVDHDDCIYYSGNPYHIKCVKCSECNKTFDINEDPDNYVCITPGLFLCRQHYNDFLNSKNVNQTIMNEYKEKKKQNFVEEVFNQPTIPNENLNNYQPEDIFITPEISDDSIQKKPYEDFIPTITLHFNKSPNDIDYDQLMNLLGDDAVILNVDKGSTIIKIALLSVIDCDSSENKKYEKFVSDFKGKLTSSIGKAVVGNLVEEPIINYPSDDHINTAYNKTSINHLQSMQELNSLEINELKKKVLQNLQKDKSNYNWKFIFSHEKLFDQLEEQVRRDIENNPYELIIVGQTIIADKYLDEYEKIKSKISQDEVVERFLYHGSALKNHQKIVKQHFLMPGQDKNIKQIDAGYYGKGIYATENIFYALMYANGYRVLDINESAYVLCCKAIFNNSKIKDLTDLSDFGKPVADDIRDNYGINHAFVGDCNDFKPINFIEKSNCKIYGHEFVFPNKYQFIPCCSFKIMRKDHYILWKDENLGNKEKTEYLKQLSKNLEVNIYAKEKNDDAYKVLKTKKHVMVKLISNSLNGKEFINNARDFIGTHFVSLVFTNSTDHMSWVSEMENVLLTTDPEDLKKFAALKMDENDVFAFANYLKSKYETSQYKFNINKSELLHFPERVYCYLDECIIA